MSAQFSAENYVDRVVGLVLSPREAKDCKLWSLTLPIGAQWVIVMSDERERVWRSYKLMYTANNDKEQWVPLSGYFNTAEEAEKAIKIYCAQVRPIFLTAMGERINA